MTTAAKDPDISAMQTVLPNTDWWNGVAKMIVQYGFTTVLAAVLLYYIATNVIGPMQADQKRFMDSVISVNSDNAKTMARQTEIQQQQATAMAQIIPLLQQIRDDQRTGAWMGRERTQP